ncbi:MAG: GMC family oxidoreductase [Candidatus Nanopelagicales bacterium]|nr:GMC family oxidoreductase [Candidatus Nanopelagicales bacterium]MDZ4249585.1 GMC family oxidoreductase [Candidatus Nanopelagicales bacterium]
MTEFDADVLVIGSGFGGSVAAFRAAEAGMRVLVVEEGRRLTPHDLQRGAGHTRSLMWEPRLGLRGYFRQTMLRDVVVVSGVGVGGGSIVYAAVLLQPPAEAFAADGWARTGIDWADELEPHFDVAAAKLGRQFNPRHGLQDEWLEQSAAALGVADTFGPTPQGIDFSMCKGCAQCITGCPHGAKNSLDVTYLADAENLGAVIRPQTRAEIVIPLAPDGSGDPQGCGRHGWRVVLRDPLARGRRTGVSSVTAREVVLAAGVLGTTRLLLANRDRWRTLPRLSAAVGRHVRTNSEAFAAVLHPRGTDISDGSTISSHYYPDSLTHVTNNRFPKSYGFMKWYLSPSVSQQDKRSRRLATMRRMARQPVASTANLRARHWNRRTTILTVMQSADNELRLVYRRRAWGWALGSEAAEGSAPIPAHLPQADAAGAALAEASGGTAFGTLMDSICGISATAHILGGAPVGPNPELGVVDTEHRVFGYEGLRVMDGSAMPTNIGVNPSLTITAMAERAMARWIQS